MTERKPLRWASPENAWAVGAQLIAFFIPVLSVTEVYQPVALEAINVLVADVWQWVLLIGACMALIAVAIMPSALGNGARMQAVARFEAIGTAVIALCLGALWGALVREYGFASNPLTQLLIAGLAFTAAGRVAQLSWQAWRYRRALKAPQVAHTEAIAHPKET